MRNCLNLIPSPALSVLFSSFLVIESFVAVNAQGMMEHAGTNAMVGAMGSGLNKGSTVKSLSNIYSKGYSVSGSQANSISKNNNSVSNSSNKKGKFADSEVQAAVADSDKLYKLGEQQEKLGKLEEAKQFYYKAALARVHIWGDGDPAVAKISLQIGQIEVKQKRFDSARLWFKKCVASVSKHYGPGDFELVLPLEELAKVEVATSHHTDASAYYQHILALQEKKWGEDNEKCLPARMALIEQCIAAKDIDEADAILNKAFEIEKRAGGNARQNTVKLEQLRASVQSLRTSDTSK